MFMQIICAFAGVIFLSGIGATFLTYCWCKLKDLRREKYEKRIQAHVVAELKKAKRWLGSESREIDFLCDQMLDAVTDNWRPMPDRELREQFRRRFPKP